MLLNLQNFIKNKHFNNVKKNLFLSVIIKFFSVILLFAIPKIILLNLDSDSYGLYLTIISISMFFTFMDFGLGNNLRNKIIQLDTLNLKNEINQLISTTYLLLFINIIFLLSIFFLIKGFINWFYFFEDSNLDSSYINKLINIFIFYVISTILLRNLNYILYAKHLSYFVDLIDVSSKLFFFIILFFIYYQNIYIDISVLIYSHIISYLFVNLIANIFFF